MKNLTLEFNGTQYPVSRTDGLALAPGAAGSLPLLEEAKFQAIIRFDDNGDPIIVPTQRGYGADQIRINQHPIAARSQVLRDGDVIDLGGGVTVKAILTDPTPEEIEQMMLDSREVQGVMALVREKLQQGTIITKVGKLLLDEAEGKVPVAEAAVLLQRVGTLLKPLGTMFVDALWASHSKAAHKRAKLVTEIMEQHKLSEAAAVTLVLSPDPVFDTLRKIGEQSPKVSTKRS